jgi:eukaryotic-like serine/threonine-protein kinase
LVLVDRTGKLDGEIGEATLIHTSGISLRFGEVALARLESQSFDIWLFDLGRRMFSRFTSHASSEIVPIFSTKRDLVVFTSNRDGRLNLYRAAVDHPAEAERLTQSPNTQVASSWAPAGSRLVFDEFTPSTRRDIWLVDLNGDRKPVPLVRTAFDESNGKISPDGKWLVYESDETGRQEVYVQPFEGPGTKVQLSARGGRLPSWISATSLTYLEAGQMMEVGWTGQAVKGEPVVLFDRGSVPSEPTVVNYDISADGKFLLLEHQPGDRSNTSATLRLIVNWAAAPQ